jgi:hypothetical protein
MYKFQAQFVQLKPNGGEVLQTFVLEHTESDVPFSTARMNALRRMQSIIEDMDKSNWFFHLTKV